MCGSINFLKNNYKNFLKYRFKNKKYFKQKTTDISVVFYCITSQDS